MFSLVLERLFVAVLALVTFFTLDEKLSFSQWFPGTGG